MTIGRQEYTGVEASIDGHQLTRNLISAYPRTGCGLSPIIVIMFALAVGLCAGYLDVALIVFRKFFWNREGYYRSGRDFLWTVPLGHAALLVIPGLAVAALIRTRPRLVSFRVGLWLFLTLGISAAMLRTPLHIVANLILAAGLSRLVSDMVAAEGPRPRKAGYTFAGLVAILIILAALSSGQQRFQESSQLPDCPSHRQTLAMSS